MKKAVFMFPGQGAQYVGMGQDLYQKDQAAKDIFDRADDLIDIDIKKLCFEGPKAELDRTDVSQPAIFTASMAAFYSFTKQYGDINAVAALGLSLGEYTALAAAGSMSFEEGLNLVRKRGLYMQEASEINKGTMVAVIGAELETVESVCRETGCEIANLNAPGQIVVAGALESITKATGALKAAGIKRVMPLAVSGAFHSRCMLPAQEKLRAEIDKTEIKAPEITVISNVNAQEERTAEEIRTNLNKQLTGRTYWQKSIEKLLEEHQDATFFEIGPGKALKGFMKKINPQAEVVNIDLFDDITQYQQA